MDNSTGRVGEDYAAAYLKSHHYKILDRNFHSRFGEIDIVASTKQYIVFVEVKTRGSFALVSPVEAVTNEKQRKLILAAKHYLLVHRTALQPRFDVVAVLTSDGKVTNFSYLENAF